MVKYTVSDYATKINKSVQSIYGRIKRNSLECVIEDGVKYIIIEDEIKEDTTPTKQNDNKISKDIFKIMKKENKKLNALNDKLNDKVESLVKEIKHLNKELNNEKDTSIQILRQYISETKKKLAAPVEAELVEEPKKKKKKNK